MGFVSEWQQWHAARERRAGAEYGPSALESTNWLITEAAAVDGIPGLWALTDDGGVRGSELGPYGGSVVLRGDERFRIGRRELRLFESDGALALRVLNPARPQREWFTAIDAYAPDERWRLPAAFEAATDETMTVTTLDGRHRETGIAGRLHFTLAGAAHVLIATRDDRGALGAVFADGTSGLETFRFRFLDIDEPDADGATVLDFNRAHLPPCAFSDQFVCPLPPPGNRYSTPIRAGERVVVLGG